MVMIAEKRTAQKAFLTAASHLHSSPEQLWEHSLRARERWGIKAVREPLVRKDTGMPCAMLRETEIG